MRASTTSAFPSRSLLTGLALCALLAGCASQSTPASYQSGRSDTENDAQNSARAQHTHAASQLQFGFGKDAVAEQPRTADQQLIESRQVRELVEPRTFLGTVSCSPTDALCVPLRTTLTTAPSGVWRMRIEAADRSAPTHATSGCWYQVGSQPNRIILQLSNEAILAELSFLNNNQMKVQTFNQQRPTLETLLSRQADIDPISELDDRPAPECHRAQ